jgi:hypothetical protein
LLGEAKNKRDVERQNGERQKEETGRGKMVKRQGEVTKERRQ